MRDLNTTEAALLVIDVQNDFCPGGSLAVAEGDKVVPILNRIAPLFSLVVATKDWHPPGHVSFASHHGQEPGSTVELESGEQILWPDHCIQATTGAAFHPDLDVRPVNMILHKGTKPHLDSYSGFFENDHQTATGLENYLKGLGIRTVYIAGLAEDVCVYFTAKDARSLGFEVRVIADATYGVDTPAGALEAARKDMKNLGVEYVESETLQ